jgi:chitin deacetylase
MPQLLLTFDDGPGPSTAALLDVLAAAGARATFFLLGANIERMPELAVRAAREGHELGNHMYSHARVIDEAALLDELARTDALILAAGGPARPRVRLPYGVLPNDARPAMLERLGRPHVGWTADFGDWLDPDPSTLVAAMRAHVAEQHARGLDAVLDLHDSSRLGAARASTVEAVRRLLLGE